MADAGYRRHGPAGRRARTAMIITRFDAFTVVASPKSAGRVCRIIYIHYNAFDSYIFLIVRCGRDAATRDPATARRLVTFR